MARLMAEDVLDLAAYLQRIGYAGEPRADLATLREIALRHAMAIPFENIDPFCGRRVSLALPDVQRKLVQQRRGGWCFEQNLLVGEALRAVGFRVHDLAGRVLWGRAVTDRTPRTHRVLEVVANGRSWLADAGFGGLSLTGVLDLADRDVQSTPHEPFRLRDFDGSLLLEAEVDDASGAGMRWLPLYRFDRTHQWPMDFEAANFQLSQDPQSRFVTGLVLARPLESGRWMLRDRELLWRGKDGRVERRRLANASELQGVMRDAFGLDVTGIAGLAERFDALL